MAEAPTDEHFQDLLKDGQLQRAATLAIRSFGEEIVAYLWARLRDEQRVSDVFSTFTEYLWRGLPTFGFACSMRGWCFTLARNACNRYLGRDLARERRMKPLTSSAEIQNAAVEVRTRTLPFLRTEVKDQFKQLRERLSEEEQTLLLLRVDRRMSWRDIAHVLCESEAPTEGELKRVAARCRKRYQKTKDTMRALAETQGLLDS